jgi:hypothetical protein
MAARISFDPLPPRARALSRDETSKLFGGCVGYREACEKDSDCCDSGLFACKDYITSAGGSGRMCLTPEF